MGGALSAVVERNLERNPWTRLYDSGDSEGQEQLSVFTEESRVDGRGWIATVPPGTSFPTSTVSDLYIGLAALYNLQIPLEERGTRRTVTTTLAELLTLTGRVRGGRSYQLLRADFDKLAELRIHAVRTWRDGKVLAREKKFRIIDKVEYEYLRGSREPTGVRVTFSEDVCQSIAQGTYRLLDVQRYFSLPTPAARRLYRYLDLKRWRGPEPKEEVELSLTELARHLPIERAAPSHIKRTLDPAHRALVEEGFLESAEYVERRPLGRKRPNHFVRYRYGPLGTDAPAAFPSFAPVRDGDDERPEPFTPGADQLLAAGRGRGGERAGGSALAAETGRTRAAGGIDTIAATLAHLLPPDPATSGTGRSASSDHRRSRTHESDRAANAERDVRAELLGTLRDEHSVGFYTLVARTLPHDVVRNVLGGVREAMQAGVTLEAARRMFTAAIHVRAAEIGMPLATRREGAAARTEP